MLLLLAVLVCSFCFRILLADSLPHCAQHRTVPSTAATPKPDSQWQIPMSVKDGDFLVEIAMAQPTLFPLRAPPCAAGLGGYIYIYVYIYMYIYIYICTYIYMYIYIYRLHVHCIIQ